VPRDLNEHLFSRGEFSTGVISKTRMTNFPT
jgi:hypothetical protein